jgi:hypothetical protein
VTVTFREEALADLDEIARIIAMSSPYFTRLAIREASPSREPFVPDDPSLPTG